MIVQGIISGKLSVDIYSMNFTAAYRPYIKDSKYNPKCYDTSEQASILKLDDKKINILKQGKEFTVVLDENPSTGYVWTYNTTDNEAIRLINEKNILNKEKVVGTPSQKVWTFKLCKSGIFELEFYYLRPWEKNITAIKTVHYIIESR